MKRILPFLGAALILTGLGMMGTPTIADAEPLGGLPCRDCPCNPDVDQFGPVSAEESSFGGCGSCDLYHKFANGTHGVALIYYPGVCKRQGELDSVKVLFGTGTLECAPPSGSNAQFAKAATFSSTGMQDEWWNECEQSR